MKNLVKKTCPVCGKEFEGKTTQKYCSYTCKLKNVRDNTKEYRKEYYKKNAESIKEKQRPRNNKPTELMEKVCPICGETFIGNSKQVYCSDFCKNEGYKNHMKKSNEKNKKEYEKVCPVCGKTFTTNRSTVVCCSDECRKIDLRAKQKEYQSLPETKKRHSESSIRYQQKVKQLGMNIKEFKEMEASGVDMEAYLEEREKAAVRTCQVCGKEFISYNKINSTRTCPDCILKSK